MKIIKFLIALVFISSTALESINKQDNFLALKPDTMYQNVNTNP